MVPIDFKRNPIRLFRIKIIVTNELGHLILGTYQILSDKGFTKNKHGDIVFYKTVALGGVSGVLGSLAGSPMYLVKTHLQAQATKEIAFGHQHNHQGTWKALMNIFQTQGV